MRRMSRTVASTRCLPNRLPASPQAIAVEADGDALSYAQLLARAASLAAALCAAGVQPGAGRRNLSGTRHRHAGECARSVAHRCALRAAGSRRIPLRGWLSSSPIQVPACCSHRRRWLTRLPDFQRQRHRSGTAGQRRGAAEPAARRTGERRRARLSDLHLWLDRPAQGCGRATAGGAQFPAQHGAHTGPRCRRPVARRHHAGFRYRRAGIAAAADGRRDAR